MFLRHEGEIFELVYFQHVKPGKGGAFVRTKLKSFTRGNVKEVTFRAGESIESVYFEARKANFLYEQGGLYVFMDEKTYEQVELPEPRVAPVRNYLKEGESFELLYADGKLQRVEAPPFMVLEVVETDPGLKGDTASGGNKPAKLETGAVVQVPLFVKVRDRIKIDTREQKYIERV